MLFKYDNEQLQFTNKCITFTRNCYTVEESSFIDIFIFTVGF